MSLQEKKEIAAAYLHGIVRKLGEKPYIYERGGYLQTGRIVTWREMPEPYTGD